jgi:hypothetical protein
MAARGGKCRRRFVAGGTRDIEICGDVYNMAETIMIWNSSAVLGVVAEI